MMTGKFIHLEAVVKRFKEIHGSDNTEVLELIDMLLHDALCNVDNDSSGIAAGYFGLCHDLKVIIEYLYKTKE